MQRILGVSLILRGMTPVLIPLLGVYVVFGFLADLQSVLGTPVQKIQAELTEVETIYRDAEAQWRIVQSDVAELTAQIETFQVPVLLPELPDELSVPLSIPSASVAVPSDVAVEFESVGISQEVTEEVCDTIGGIFGSIGSVVCNDVTRTVTEQVRYPSDLSIGTTPFSIEMPDVELSLPVGLLGEALQPLEELFGSIQEVFGILDAVVSGFRDLQREAQALPALLQAAVQSGTAVLDLFFGMLLHLGSWQLTVLALVALMVLISLAASALSDFTRGLRLLME